MTSPIATARLRPSGHTFAVHSDQSLLDAGLSHGLALPFGCANGSCGDCRARIVAGDVARVRFHDFTLTEAQKLAGEFLLCSYGASRDIEIEVAEARSVDEMQIQTLKAKRCRIQTVDGVTLVAFKFARGGALRFLPGQWARLNIGEDEEVALPIASCPCNAGYVEFHLATKGPTARLAARVEAMTSRERAAITGPFGRFCLDDNAIRDLVFVAIGDGFASIQSLMEHVINRESSERVVLLWAASQYASHYRDNLCRSWMDAIDEFEYEAVPSSAQLPAALARHLDVGCLSDPEVFVSGPSDGSEEVTRALANLGLDRVRLNRPID